MLSAWPKLRAVEVAESRGRQGKKRKPRIPRRGFRNASLEAAAGAADIERTAIALRLVLMLEGVECPAVGLWPESDEAAN